MDPRIGRAIYTGNLYISEWKTTGFLQMYPNVPFEPVEWSMMHVAPDVCRISPNCGQSNPRRYAAFWGEAPPDE